MSKLLEAAFWKDVLDRAVRQGFQVLLPFLVLVATTSRFDLKAGVAVAVVAVTQALVVIFRALTELRVDVTAPWYLQVLDRAVAALAGSLLALFTADGFDLLAADARSIFLSAVASVAVALGNGYLSPPAAKQYALAA
jgi:hypothetical protein